MKKIMLLAGAACFLLASCCSNEEKCPANAEKEGQPKEEQKCCKEMTEEQKQACADWDNWANIDDARKEALLTDKKDGYDKCQAERAEREAQKAAIDAKMANWDKLTLDEKKALIDEMDAFFKSCHKKHADKGCCSENKGDGGCQKTCEGKKAEEGCQKTCEGKK